MHPVRVVIWLVEGTWQGALDAAAKLIPPDAHVALLHVTPSDVDEITQGATAGLLGRAFRAHRPTGNFEMVADEEALEILQAAAKRLGRQNRSLFIVGDG